MKFSSIRFLTRVSTNNRPAAILRLRSYLARTTSPLSERAMVMKAKLRRQAAPVIAVTSDVEVEVLRERLARRLRFDFYHDLTKPCNIFPPPRDLQMIRSKLSQKLKKEFEVDCPVSCSL